MDNYDPNNWSDNNNTNQNQNINGNQHPNQNYFNNDYPVPPATPKDKLATFSLILAIAGCVTSIVYYISLPCTISAIVLAILSRSRIGRFEGKAVAGLCLGISGIVLMLFFFVMIYVRLCCRATCIGSINNKRQFLQICIGLLRYTSFAKTAVFSLFFTSVE